jgi:CheY-like chemotaxis protein
VVDDEMDHCLNLAGILVEFEYRVDIAPDGPTARELVGGQAYDAALLDLVMPGTDGLGLLLSIKALRPELPACFITANPDEALADVVRTSRASRDALGRDRPNFQMNINFIIHQLIR